MRSGDRHPAVRDDDLTLTSGAGPNRGGGAPVLPILLVELLACPACRATLSEGPPGRLHCTACGGEYPVRDRVPRMLPGHLPAPLAETAGAFGWQWHAFTEQLPTFGEEFFEWLFPLTPDDFRDKRVLDAGCGNGRHLLLAAAFGAEYIVGLDLSSAVEVARRHTADLPTVDVVQGNLLTPPLAEGSFDLIYSIGVIHHVPEPEAAIRTLTTCLRPGGTLHVWVYGHEGNTLVRWFVDPLRRQLARRIPRGVVRAGSLPLAIALAATARLAARLDRVPLLPYREYLRRTGRFPVRHIWTIVYDQLMAPTTHYVKRDELETWFRGAGLTDVRLRSSRGMSWTATGHRP